MDGVKIRMARAGSAERDVRGGDQRPGTRRRRLMGSSSEMVRAGWNAAISGRPTPRPENALRASARFARRRAMLSRRPWRIAAAGTMATPAPYDRAVAGALVREAALHGVRANPCE